MVLVCLLLLLFSVSPNAWAEPLDRVVVVVESELVMASEVRLETELSGLDSSPSPFWDPKRVDPLRRLVEAAVFRLAASDVALYQPESAEVITRREAIRQRFRDRGAWTDFLSRHGLDEARLDVVLRRRIMVERYLNRNLQLPDGADLRQWHQAMMQLEQALEHRMRVRLVPVRNP